MATEPLALEGPIASTRPGRGVTRLPVQPQDIMGLAGMVLWVGGLSAVSLVHMTDLGLISVLNAPCAAGLALLLAGLVVQLVRHPDDRWRPAIYVVALVFALDGLPSFIEAAADVPTAYVHAGFIDYILRHGAVLPNYDARFSWPGMFVWGALATVAGGRSQASVYLRWAPLALDLAYLLPLRLLLRSLCPNPRVAWTAAAVFVVGNWVEQDYFSPQGVAFLGFLSVIAVVVATSDYADPLRPGTWRRRGRAVLGRVVIPRGRMTLPGVGARVATVGCCTLIVAGIASSHQLTPYSLLLDLVVLAAFGRLASPTLIAISAALSVGYLSLGAEGFWVYHASVIFGGVGQVSSSVNQGLVARVHVSAGHQFVVEARLLYAVVLVLGGALGAWIRRRQGRWGLVAALAAAPWAMVLGQAYGGEVFLRSLLLSSPFLAALIAEVLVWAVERRAVLGSIAVTATLIVGSGALILTRYGNEPFYVATPDEIAAVRAVDLGAPLHAEIAVLAQDLPWRFEDIEDHTFVSYQAQCLTNFNLACIRRVDADYVILTKGQLEAARLLVGMSSAQIDDFEHDILPAAGYRLVLSNPDALVYAHTGSPGLAPSEGNTP